MLVLKLAYSEEFTIGKDLQELRDILKKKKIIIGLVESIEDKVHLIKIICNDDVFNDKVKEIVNLYVSNILYKIVIENYRQKEMFEFLIDNYFFLKQNEILEVEEKILQILNCENRVENEMSIYCLNRINLIINKIKDCIGEKQEINIEGFMTFRIKELREDIEKIVDKVIEKYMVEKEYEEFVKLLKYFVEVQECKIEKVDINISNKNHYSVRDGYGKDLYKDFLNQVSTEKNISDVNIEDILISGLITNSPNDISIYGTDNCDNKEFLETIKSVFGEKVKLYNKQKLDCL